jgi:hypothetical protein
MWLGPAPWAPYHEYRISGSYDVEKKVCWRAWKDYSGGLMTDWGAHHMGGALFAVGLWEMQPTGVDYHNDKDGVWLSFPFANGTAVTLNRPKTEHLKIEGTPNDKQPAKPIPSYKGHGSITGDFLECVKTREKPFRDIQRAINTMTVCHLALIAYDLKRSLKWDADKQVFANDAEANRFLDRARREPWVL